MDRSKNVQKMVCDCGFEAYTSDALEAHLLSHVEESRKPSKGMIENVKLNCANC